MPTIELPSLHRQAGSRRWSARLECAPDAREHAWLLQFTAGLVFLVRSSCPFPADASGFDLWSAPSLAAKDPDYLQLRCIVQAIRHCLAPIASTARSDAQHRRSLSWALRATRTVLVCILRNWPAVDPRGPRSDPARPRIFHRLSGLPRSVRPLPKRPVSAEPQSSLHRWKIGLETLPPV